MKKIYILMGNPDKRGRLRVNSLMRTKLLPKKRGMKYAVH
jgi:hypothetical protein